MTERRDPTQVRERLADGGSRLVRSQAFARAPLRLADRGPQDAREDQPWSPEADEGPAPANGIRQPAAEREPGHRTERPAGRVDRHRGGAPLRRKVVGEQRLRRAAPDGLAGPDADPRREEMSIGPSGPGQRGEGTPQEESGSDHGAPAPHVGEPRHRQHREHVGERERASGQQPHLGVRDRELEPDRLDEDGQHLSVHHVQGGQQEADAEDVARVAARGSDRSGHAGSLADGEDRVFIS